MHSSACKGKFRYDSRAKAKRGCGDRKMYQYSCQICGGWHNTSEKPYKPHRRGAKKWYGGDLPTLEELD